MSRAPRLAPARPGGLLIGVLFVLLPLLAALAHAPAAAQPGAAAEPAEAAPRDIGVTLRVFQLEQPTDGIPALEANQTPNAEERSDTVAFTGDDGFLRVASPVRATVVGELRIRRPGSYVFRLHGRDAARLSIGPSIVAQTGQGTFVRDSQPIELTAGVHPLRIEHAAASAERTLRLEWRPPWAHEFTLVPPAALQTEAGVTRVVAPGTKRIEQNRRPGDRTWLDGVHPGWDLATLHPPAEAPMVGALCLTGDGRLIVGTFSPLQRDEVSLPDIDSKPPDRLYEVINALGDDPASMRLIPVADGLYEPAGLCAVGDSLYVSHRLAISRLDDTDGDGFFETRTDVASGWEGWNYHQFTFGLVHRDGRLYAALSTAMAPPKWQGMGTNAAPNGPLRGGILEVDLGSGDTRVIAAGTRTPNGIGPGPGNDLFYADNQGTWMPTNHLAAVTPGAFYGHYNRTNLVPNLADRFPSGGFPSIFCDRPRAAPAVYLPHGVVSNSPTEPVLIEDGLFAGQMFLGELTAGGVRRVALERVNGQWQGAVFRFTQGLESGVNRMRFGPDGALYLGGIGAGGNWNWRETRSGLQRLTPNGSLVFEMHSITAVPEGFRIRFTKPVDRAWLADAASYTLRDWTYEPTAAYGGEPIGVRPLRVIRATPDDDARGVVLAVDDLREGRCVEFVLDPVSVDGEAIWSTDAWYTLNHLQRAPADQLLPGGVGIAAATPPEGVMLLSRSAAEQWGFAGRPISADANRTQDDLLADDEGISLAEVGGSLTSTGRFADVRLHLEARGADGAVLRFAGATIAIAGEQMQAVTGAGPAIWNALDLVLSHAGGSGGTVRDLLVNGRRIDPAALSTVSVAASAPQPSALVLEQERPNADVQVRHIWAAPIDEPLRRPGPWIQLFDGTSLAGWSPVGGIAEFDVRDAAIIARANNAFDPTTLLHDRLLADFELLAEVRASEAPGGGVLIRAGDGDDARGLLVAIDSAGTGWSGGVLDAAGREWILTMADRPYARAAWKQNAWNRLRIVAEGPVIRTWVNGIPAGQVLDQSSTSGRLGLRIAGSPRGDATGTVSFRNIRLRELAATEPVDLGDRLESGTDSNTAVPPAPPGD